MKNLLIWVLQAVLAFVFAAVGIMKLVMPATDLIANGLTWVAAFPPVAVQGIGVLEILGAIGLIVPLATGIRRELTPIAAAALAVMQLGAMLVHVVLGEAAQTPVNLVLIALLLVVVWGRRAMINRA